MEEEGFQQFHQGGFVGKVRDDWAASLDETRLAGLREEVVAAKDGVLARGRHEVVVLSFEVEGEPKKVAVKAFGPQPGWKDRLDSGKGTKAARSFQAAVFLEKNGVQTPAPLACIERWEGRRLVESYYLSEYLEGLSSFKTSCMSSIGTGNCDVLVSLLEKIGFAMKRMHDAGFYHRDLGNQNMELTRDEAGNLDGVYFIDLNRGKIKEELSMKERALDFARLRLPSEFVWILTQIYWQKKAPKEFKAEVRKARRRFRFWLNSRRWRHPIKSRKKARAVPSRGNPRMEDVWIWDQRSAQAAITMDKVDRKRHQSFGNHLKVAGSVLKNGLGVWKEYRRQMEKTFAKEVKLAGRIGMAIESADLEVEPQLDFLKKLGTLPVLLRFGHHESREQWEKTLDVLEKLHADGHEIMVAVLQDRRAVLEPESWREFLEFLFERLSGKVAMVELCHVVNRMKWGIHNLREHARLLEPVRELQERFPEVPISGPACIDFEYHYLISALGATPKGLYYDALSHHLYVDRRGAPENKQGRFGTVEKAGLLRAVARHSGRCDERVIVSEVNWPIEGTGVWSPVSASYLTPGSKVSKVHVSEEEYGCYMLRYLVLTLCSGFVDQVYWWRLVAHGFGLIDERGGDGWRERVGFQMLRVFLEQLGSSMFLEKMEIEEDVYAFRFGREKDQVVMMWCQGRIFNGPWPVESSSVLDACGEVIDLTEVGESPVYLICEESGS